MKRLIAFSVLAVAMLAACSQERSIMGLDANFAGAGAKLGCPSLGTPSPGTQVRGGLEVNGVCILDGVTVNGGITVDSGGHLQVQSSTVNGGIAVLQCGEVDVNATTNNVGAPTGTTSTINGGLDINASTACSFPAFSDADIWAAHINGEISLTGSYRGTPLICSNQISGNVRINDLTIVGPVQFFIGDPDGPFGCPGNTITGALSLRNSSRFEVESNSVGGSVLLSGSTLQLNGNTIGGSLLCSNGTVIQPGEPVEDPSGNTVRGANTC